MILKFSNGKTFELADNIEPKERVKEINKVLATMLRFHGEDMTVDEYFRYTFDNKDTRSLLERISFYLSKMPEQNGQHDKGIISRNDEMEMNKGVRWANRNNKKVLEPARYKTFTESSIDEKASFGMVELDDSNYN